MGTAMRQEVSSPTQTDSFQRTLGGTRIGRYTFTIDLLQGRSLEFHMKLQDTEQFCNYCCSYGHTVGACRTKKADVAAHQTERKMHQQQQQQYQRWLEQQQQQRPQQQQYQQSSHTIPDPAEDGRGTVYGNRHPILSRPFKPCRGKIYSAPFLHNHGQVHEKEIHAQFHSKLPNLVSGNNYAATAHSEDGKLQLQFHTTEEDYEALRYLLQGMQKGWQPWVITALKVNPSHAKVGKKP